MSHCHGVGTRAHHQRFKNEGVFCSIDFDFSYGLHDTRGVAKVSEIGREIGRRIEPILRDKFSDKASMSDTATFVKDTSVRWWPVILRGGLYIFLALISSLESNFRNIANSDLPDMTWMDWVKIALSVIGATGLSLRTYIDQSLARHKVEIGDKSQA